MTPDEYLHSLITKYRASTGKGSAAYNAGNAIYPLLEKWAGAQLREITFSGSNAKGTAIHGTTDVDLFISLKDNTKETLKQLFDMLYNKVRKNGYPDARKQNVSIHIIHHGIDVDLVPGVHYGGNSEDHWLYVNKANQERIKTNIYKHIEIVRSSGRVNEIIITKIWRKLFNLDFPSFYLELVVLETLKYSRAGLAGNFLTVLEYMSNSLTSTRFVDPSNSNNIISDELTSSEKTAIANLARRTRGQDNWGKMVW